jgi:hypothetical protein
VCLNPYTLAPVVTELRKARAYKSALVGLELKRRLVLERGQSRLFPDLAALKAERDTLEQERDKLDDDIRRVNSLKRKRGTDEAAGLKAAKAVVRAKLKPIYDKIKQTTIALNGQRDKQGNVITPPNPIWDAFRTKINKSWALAINSKGEGRKGKGLRAKSGLFFGTYQAIDESVKTNGPPPNSRRWNSLRLHFQGASAKTWGEILLGQCSDLEITTHDGKPVLGPFPADPKEFQRHLNATTGRKHLVADMRVDRAGTRVKIPFLMHRPIPVDAKVTWLTLSSRREGINWRWSLQFTFKADMPVKRNPPYIAPYVGINLGYRRLYDIEGNPDGLRVAYWRDANGPTGHATIPAELTQYVQKTVDGWQLVFPERQVEGFKICEELRSVRDLDKPVNGFANIPGFDSIRAELGQWLTANACPDELREKLANLGHWKSKGKLSGVHRYWSANRFAGDEIIFQRLEAWAKRERHLYEWESNQREKMGDWRKDLYRKFALFLYRKYQALRICEVDWAGLGTDPEPEEPKDKGKIHYRRTASPGHLDETLVKIFGPNVVQYSAKDITNTCAACGVICKRGRDQFHTCEGCGARWDIDSNAAENLCK